MRQTALGEEPLKGLHSNCNGYLGPEEICISVEWGRPSSNQRSNGISNSNSNFPLNKCGQSPSEDAKGIQQNATLQINLEPFLHGPPSTKMIEAQFLRG